MKSNIRVHIKETRSLYYFPYPYACLCMSIGRFDIPSFLLIVFNTLSCWGLREWGQSSQGACKEEGVKRRKGEKGKLTFESKTAGGEEKQAAQNTSRGNSNREK